jgi:hypothetical protein
MIFTPQNEWLFTVKKMTGGVKKMTVGGNLPGGKKEKSLSV